MLASICWPVHPKLVLLADDSAHPDRVAADLLAQAEHDTDARVFLITDSEPLIKKVNLELDRQLEILPTHETARVAVAGGAAILCDSSVDSSTRGLYSMVAIANRLAPEHLELHVKNAADVAPRIRHAGCHFYRSRIGRSLWRLWSRSQPHIANCRNGSLECWAERLYVFENPDLDRTSTSALRINR